MSKRTIKPAEPPLQRKLELLEMAADASRVGTVWAWVWTYMSAGWLVKMVKDGLLTVSGSCDYGSFGYSGGTDHSITDKGRKFLEQYGAPTGEW